MRLILIKIVTACPGTRSLESGTWTRRPEPVVLFFRRRAGPTTGRVLFITQRDQTVGRGQFTSPRKTTTKFRSGGYRLFHGPIQIRLQELRPGDPPLLQFKLKNLTTLFSIFSLYGERSRGQGCHPPRLLGRIKALTKITK